MLSLVPLLVLPLIGVRFVEVMVELARNERLENLDMAARILSLPFHERPELFVSPETARGPEAVRALAVGRLPAVKVDQDASEWRAVPGQVLVDVSDRSGDTEPTHATVRLARSDAAPGRLYLLVVADDESFVRPQMRSGVRQVGDELIVSVGERAAEMRDMRIQPVQRDGGWQAEIELDPEPQLLRVRIIDIDQVGRRRVEGTLDSGLLTPTAQDGVSAPRDPRMALWGSAARSLERSTGRVSIYDAAGELLARSGELVPDAPNDEDWTSRLARQLLRLADALRPAGEETVVADSSGRRTSAAADGATVVTGVAGTTPPPRASTPAAERTRPATPAVAERAATVSTVTRALSGLPAHSARRIEAESGVPSWLLASSHPLWVGDRVVGALTIEENSASRLVFGQRAIERLTLLAAAALITSAIALLMVGSVTVWRIVRLRREAEGAIDARGRVVGAISHSAIRDEIGALAISYADVLARLGQYQQYLANLRSRLVHELRTPIMVVRSSLDNLAAESDETMRSGYLDRVREGAQRLERILASMGEASSLESMLADSDLERVSLADLVEGCADGYRSAFPCEFIVDRDPANEGWCMVAPDAIAQALDKLVSNAVDFATPGSPIRLSLRRVGERRPSWRFSVINRGLQLPPKMGDLLFDSMVSVRTRAGGHAAHLGMGLYMVRLIAEFHGGRAFARDVPGGVEVGFTVADRI